MVENLKLKEKNNKRKIAKNAETLAAVHTHTHTHTQYCYLENKIKVKKVDNKNKGRTMFNYSNIGLPLCAFAKQMFIKVELTKRNFKNVSILSSSEEVEIKHNRCRAGP